ncbi:hypothetical protein EVAR_48017_1 [Eumeta japonica]|uniref:Uncharacterized protein n=1 Tax=Eumeta variegata TaxID=151549 RepID=A0A4C1XNA2_EUMVA|nr:hypothetical protein EVAR_48017_1 [Eumeta japonica]
MRTSNNTPVSPLFKRASTAGQPQFRFAQANDARQDETRTAVSHNIGRSDRHTTMNMKPQWAVGVKLQQNKLFLHVVTRRP